MTGPLERELRAKRDAGRKLLVPYITGGFEGWEDAVRAAAANGADAIEIGIPFSDPVMDGPVIQQASQAALDRGATPLSVLASVPELDVEVPLVVMTYYNIVHHDGHRRFAHRLVEAGVAGCILPDLPLEESEPWCRAADHEGVETVMLAAPTAPDERLPRIAARARGFVYSVGLLGVTGEREQLAASATALAARVKAITDVPVLVGVGVSDAEQAYQASRIADGVWPLLHQAPKCAPRSIARRSTPDSPHTRNEGRLRPSLRSTLHGVCSARCPPRAAICALPPG